MGELPQRWRNLDGIRSRGRFERAQSLRQSLEFPLCQHSDIIVRRQPTNALTYVTRGDDAGLIWIMPAHALRNHYCLMVAAVDTARNSTAARAWGGGLRSRR